MNIHVAMPPSKAPPATSPIPGLSVVYWYGHSVGRSLIVGGQSIPSPLIEIIYTPPTMAATLPPDAAQFHNTNPKGPDGSGGRSNSSGAKSVGLTRTPSAAASPARNRPSAR